MTYKIIRSHVSLLDLESRVNAATDYGPTGGPFRDPDSREWCQAVVLKRIPAPVGGVRLQEPAKKR